MSYAIGKAALNLQWTERVARTEYMDSQEVIRHYSGMDTSDPQAFKAFCDAWHLDFLWNVNDGPEPWKERGRVTDMGHAVYADGGTDFHESVPCPFTSVKEVLEFDAVKEYGLTDYAKLVKYYDEGYKGGQGYWTDQVLTGGYYNTLVSGAIQIFGWDLLLEALGDDPDRMGDQVFGSIFEQSLHHYKAYAESSIEFFMCHDDMVWTEGPFINPDFYRTYIFPRYKELWKPLKDAGKRVLYTADGTFDMFIDDLVEAGADGFCFEPTNNLELLASKVGQTHVLIGGADCRTMTFGSKADIEQELRWAYDIARKCPGFVFCTGNHFPANIPLDNAQLYFKLVEELGVRS